MRAEEGVGRDSGLKVYMRTFDSTLDPKGYVPEVDTQPITIRSKALVTHTIAAK